MKLAGFLKDIKQNPCRTWPGIALLTKQVRDGADRGAIPLIVRCAILAAPGNFFRIHQLQKMW